MKLSVGVAGYNRGWDLLLQQIGVPYEFISDPTNDPSYSVVVAGDDCGDIEPLERVLDAGGAVLCSGRTYERLTGTPSLSRHIRYCASAEGGVFAGTGLIDIDLRCAVPSNANELEDESGSPTAFAGLVGRGTVVALAFDPAALVTDFRTTDRSFYADAARLAFEKVPTVRRGGIRSLVVRSLEYLFRSRNLPFVHVWHFPKDLPTQFALRIDTDAAYKREVQSLHELSLKNQVPMTWFVDVKTQEPHLPLFASMSGHEVGLHGFEHKEFRKQSQYRSDILRGMEAMERVGMEATSYAAPYGNWNTDLQRLMHELRFTYSSEFRYDVDNLPSYPVIDGAQSASLQVPVHPVSIGTLRRQGYSEDKLRDYFIRVLEEKRARCEPLFLYHHPSDGFLDVLESVFDWVRTKNPHVTTLGAYAAWWKRRIAVKPSIELEPHFLRVNTDRTDDSVWLRVLDTNGKEAFSPLMREIPLAGLKWKSVPKPPQAPEDIARVRAFNYRIPLTKAVDFIGRIFA